MNLPKALTGLILIFVVHIPKLIYQSLLLSYALVFNNQQNLTADPKEHLSRARKLLAKRQNSLLLYAALEIRFALERIVDNQLMFAEKVSASTLKKYDPVKKRKAMTALDPNSDYSHRIYLVNMQTNERFEWAKYKPLNLEKVSSIKGRLGDLLHSKVGLRLGVSDDPWYIETRAFLIDAEMHLSDNLKDNDNFFFYSKADAFEVVREPM
jgi:hypothetical protein